MKIHPLPPAALPLIASLFLIVANAAQALERVTQADFGQTREGSAVKLITLRNAKGMSAQIITYGAIICVSLPSCQNNRTRN